MWNYEKRLQYPINIKQINPSLAAMIISQYGGLYFIMIYSFLIEFLLYKCKRKISTFLFCTLISPATP